MAAKYSRKDQYEIWSDRPFSAIGKRESEDREQRIAATRRMTEGLADDAFSDNADVSCEDTRTYYPKETTVMGGGIAVYDEGDKKK